MWHSLDLTLLVCLFVKIFLFRLWLTMWSVFNDVAIVPFANLVIAPKPFFYFKLKRLVVGKIPIARKWLRYSNFRNKNIICHTMTDFSAKRFPSTKPWLNCIRKEATKFFSGFIWIIMSSRIFSSVFQRNFGTKRRELSFPHINGCESGEIKRIF